MAGSCIGVVCLVITLEGLRRAALEYDALLARQAASTLQPAPSSNLDIQPGSNANGSFNKAPAVRTTQATAPTVSPRMFTPSLSQQLVRSLLHMLQFAVAYFVMLLAMYFNGYIIISIVCSAGESSVWFQADKYSL